MKQGEVVSFYKGKGDQRLALAQRSILLSNTIAKVQHQFLRSQVWSCLEACLVDSQCGGLKGKSADVATHWVRSRIRAQKRCGFCSAAFFS
eukprot:4794749-Pyramimonas_sp.AAC.1